MFQVGQKIVCVNDGPSRFNPSLPTKVKKGIIYTVRKCWLHSRYGVPVVLLNEIEPDTKSRSFDAERFRPVVERKTDISVFIEMLTDAKFPALTQQQRQETGK